jgi:hypothetical protein
LLRDFLLALTFGFERFADFTFELLVSMLVLDIDRHVLPLLCALQLVRDLAADSAEEEACEIDAIRIPPQGPIERLDADGVQPIIRRLRVTRLKPSTRSSSARRTRPEKLSPPARERETARC